MYVEGHRVDVVCYLVNVLSMTSRAKGRLRPDRLGNERNAVYRRVNASEAQNSIIFVCIEVTKRHV